MLVPSQHRPARGGFTLIELLVAAALTILIMAILGTAFQQGLGTLSQLKSSGDLASRLRAAENAIRNDLETTHFAHGEVNSAGDSPGFMNVSDIRNGNKPVGGYFKIEGGASNIEGYDQDGLSSTTATGHSISMTLVRKGNTLSDMFVDSVTGNTSRTAEVLWALSNAETATTNGVRTYSLYRYQKLIPNANALQAATASTLNRLAPAQSSDAIVLSNVLSFEVKPTWEGGSAPRSAASGNGDFPFDNVPGGSYDSNNATIRVTAVLIKIRIYDPKNKMTRQSSIVVKL